jgi:methionyl-tRNA synthetase
LGYRYIPGFTASEDWSSEQLENNAAELQSLLGNFYLRITSAVIRKRLPEDFDSHSQESLEQSLISENLREVAKPLQHLTSVVDHHLKELRVAEALEAIIHQLKAVCPVLSFMGIVDLSSQANAMMNATEPWGKNTPEAVTGKVYALSLETLRICGILLQPFIPAKAGMLLDALGIPQSERALQHAQYLRRSIGNITPGVKLFSRASRNRV